ncbi:MAG: hypothetical protein WCW65_02560 [Candidatus Paceibacterota bacterium]
MKSYVLLFVLFLGFSNLHSQTVTVVTTTNGIAPIPAFTLGEPAALVFLSTNLSEHFSFSPDIAFSMKDGSFWFSDLWLRYHTNLDSAKKWTLIVAVDYPSFIGGSATNAAGRKISTTEIYPTGQLCLEKKVRENNSLVLDYWYLKATDMITGIKGSYLSLSFYYNKPLKNLSFGLHPNLFYLNYSDGTKGFVGALDVKLSHNKSGLFFASQGISPLGAEKVRSGWNLSLGITRKMF